MNDVYLKANAQEAGTKSYGRMVDLLLAMKREQGDAVNASERGDYGIY